MTNFVYCRDIFGPLWGCWASPAIADGHVADGHVADGHVADAGWSCTGAGPALQIAIQINDGLKTMWYHE